MDISYLAVLGATVLQFIIGWVWYGPIFGTTWGKIHGFDTLSPEAQKEAMKGMWRLLVAQFVVTIVTTVVLASMMLLVSASPYWLAALLWIGFVVPTQVSAVLFGGTKPEWIVTKIAIMAGGSLVCLEVAAIILSMF